MTNSYFDHVGILLDKEFCLQIGPPHAQEIPAYYFLTMSRKPLVLRLPQELKEKFLQNARGLLDRGYNYFKALHTWGSLVLYEKAGVALRIQDKHPERIICSDAILEAHPRIQEIRKKFGIHLDYSRIGSHSLNDYLVLAERGEFEVVKLPFPMNSIGSTEGKNYSVVARRILQKESLFSSIVNLNNIIVTGRLLSSTKKRKFRNAYRLVFAVAQAMKMMRINGVELFQIISFVWPRI